MDMIRATLLCASVARLLSLCMASAQELVRVGPACSAIATCSMTAWWAGACPRVAGAALCAGRLGSLDASGLLTCWGAAGPTAPQTRPLLEWNFDTAGDLQGWGCPNFISDLEVRDGALQGRITGWDPFVRSPQFEIPATPWQFIEVRMKTDGGGVGEFFWTNTTESPYGGFFPGKETGFEIIGDNQWHVYRIYPFWHTEKKIILLRLDFPHPKAADEGKASFAVDWIRVVDLGEPDRVITEPAWDFTQGVHEWAVMGEGTLAASPEGLRFETVADGGGWLVSPPLRCPVEARGWVSVEMTVDKGYFGQIQWVSGARPGLQSVRFPLRPDGRMHTYNVDVSASAAWTGEVLMLGVVPCTLAGVRATIRRIGVYEEPQGGPEIECSYVGLEHAINRTGTPAPLLINLLNRGGAASTDLRVAEILLPDGVTVVEKGEWRAVGEIEPFESTQHRIYLSAERPVEGEVVVQLSGTGAPTTPVKGQIAITAPLGLPKADYVPEPQPVASDYEIGALYFPGWPSMSHWDPIRRCSPERKPVLGWYDEGNPECVDWQIKWAVEHGIQFFMVDWYWSAGGRSLEHWVNAFKRARYRKYLKWCMMWANHNAPNTHSAEDQRNVTQYWLDNYFNMPEYYRINDMPVVMIWSVQNMENDMAGKGGAKRLLEISQEMARAAGYKGIWFVAMKWPEESTDPAIIQSLADKGFAMTSIYHYMWHGGKAEDPRHYPFELVAQSSYDHWRSWHAADIIPFLPNLSTGWDSRPWHGEAATVVSGRSVALFRRICEDAKRFADATGVKRLVLGPLNEWGEGSYAEPNKEFGFGMYDAVRDVFCKRPAQGWPPNIAPVDVGLGPYDYPEAALEKRTAWDFSDGPQGWGPMMGVTNFRAQDGALRFTTTSGDPAITGVLGGIPAKRWRSVVIRMRITSQAAKENDLGQLFWATTTAGISELNSTRFPVINDSQAHTYVLPVSENPRWRGTLQTFRLDPCITAGTEVVIEEIRLSAEAGRQE